MVKIAHVLGVFVLASISYIFYLRLLYYSVIFYSVIFYSVIFYSFYLFLQPVKYDSSLDGQCTHTVLNYDNIIFHCLALHCTVLLPSLLSLRLAALSFSSFYIHFCCYSRHVSYASERVQKMNLTYKSTYIHCIRLKGR